MFVRTLAIAAMTACLAIPAALPAAAGKKVILKGPMTPVKVQRCTTKRICYPVSGGGQRCEDVKLCSGTSTTI